MQVLKYLTIHTDQACFCDRACSGWIRKTKRREQVVQNGRDIKQSYCGLRIGSHTNLRHCVDQLMVG
eukprot:6487184-Amphidinium_carterae.2